MDIDRYMNIINLHRPISQKHGCMTRLERAKQFAPFAALKGFERSLEYENRTIVPRITLSEESIDKINRTLQTICVGDIVTMTYFKPDELIIGYGSLYVASGPVLNLNPIKRTICIEKEKIVLDDIVKIERD